MISFEIGRKELGSAWIVLRSAMLSTLLTDVFRMLTWTNRQQLSRISWQGDSFQTSTLHQRRFFRLPGGDTRYHKGCWLEQNDLHRIPKHSSRAPVSMSHKPAGSRPWRRFPEHNGSETWTVLCSDRGRAGYRKRSDHLLVVFASSRVLLHVRPCATCESETGERAKKQGS